MSNINEIPEGATPLDDDDMDGLLIDGISIKSDLNLYEQQNILDSFDWSDRQKIQNVSPDFVLTLHKKMFCDVWEWAGSYRTTNKSIGVDKAEITRRFYELCDDVNYWIGNEVYDPIEIAVRFHHRLVSIHLFPNGNGRHARMMADIILEKIFGISPLPWGGENLYGDNRQKYINALRLADNHDYTKLIEFAKSP